MSIPPKGGSDLFNFTIMDILTKRALDYAHQCCGFREEDPAKVHLCHLGKEYYRLLNLAEELGARLAGELTCPPTLNKHMAQVALGKLHDFLPNSTKQQH